MKFANKSVVILFLVLTTFNAYGMEEDSIRDKDPGRLSSMIKLAPEEHQEKKSIQETIKAFFSWCWNNPSLNPFGKKQYDNKSIHEIQQIRDNLNRDVEATLHDQDLLAETLLINLDDLLTKSARTQKLPDMEEEEEEADLPTDYVSNQEASPLNRDDIKKILNTLLQGISDNIDNPDQATASIPDHLKAFFKEVLIETSREKITQATHLFQKNHAKFLIKQIKETLHEKENVLNQELANLARKQTKRHNQLRDKQENHGAIINIMIKNKHRIRLLTKRFMIVLIIDFFLARGMDLIFGGMPLFFVMNNLIKLPGLILGLPGYLAQLATTNLQPNVNSCGIPIIVTPTIPPQFSLPLNQFSKCVQCIKKIIKGNDVSSFQWTLDNGITEKLTPTDLTNFVKEANINLIEKIAQCLAQCPKKVFQYLNS